MKVKVNYSSGLEKELTQGIAFTITDGKIVMHITTDAADTITIYRQTDTSALIDFNDGSVLRRQDLNTLQNQLLHVIEENGTFMVSEVTKEQASTQIERTVKLADGVTCTRGMLLGYKAGGFVLADNTDYSTLKDLVLALSTPTDGKVLVLSMGQYGTNDFADGKTCFVGTKGMVVGSPPISSGSFIKIVGSMEGDILMFNPDSIAIQLA